MRYLSVCSGIEAATAAWHPLGWEPVAFSEVDAFPSAVLKHHYPSVPNWGDMTKFQEWLDADVDVLVGGTPCQSFSVAGLRKGLDDPRGNLMLVYLALADRYRPEWLVWENVPGVLSSNQGRDFGAFLGGLAELGYGWAYRVLDAQYFGLAQRRRRVFVVASARGWQRAAAVLFERESLSGHPAPRREAGQVAPTVPARRTAGGGFGTDFDCDGGLIPQVANPLTARMHKGINTTCDEGQTMVAHSLRADGFDASEDGTGRGTPLVPAIAPCLTRNYGKQPDSSDTNAGPMLIPVAHAFDARQSDVLQYGNQTGPLDTYGSSIGVMTLAIRGRAGGVQLEVREDGTANAVLTPSGGRGGIGVGAVAFSAKDYGADAGDIAPTLRAGGHTRSHANGGVMPAVAYGIGSKASSADADASNRSHSAGGPAGMGIQEEMAHALRAGRIGQVAHAMAVRRLTPRECERLQGFPDDYTAVPYRGKPAADGPRYKALGNSMAVPVMAWIGKRIQMVEEL